MGNTTIYVNNQWVESDVNDEVEVINPANEEIVGSVTSAEVVDVDAAVQAAVDAKKEWALTPAPTRGQTVRKIADILLENKNELAKILIQEQGKPRSQAEGEIVASADMSVYMAEWDRRIEGDVVPGDFPNEKLTLERRPIGVVAAIIPWNYPVALFMRKVAPALVTGNTVVAKPSSNTPLATVRLMELIDEQDILPPGVLNLVTGKGSVVGEALVTDERVDMVTMTGDTSTGKRINESVASSLKPVALELGGKAPAIVWNDANLQSAVDDILTARIANAGQVCTCAERVYVHKDVAEEFTDRLIEAADNVVIGDPSKDPDMGPQVSKGELESTQNAVDDALTNGATLRTGGRAPSGTEFEQGYWYEPTILTDVTHEMEIMHEEVFGPVIPIVEVETMNEVIELANDSNYGLSSYLFTNNYELINRAIDELEFGETYINRSLGESWQGHHIGWGESGIGGEDGKYGLLKYTQLKTIYHNYDNVSQ
jgi:lactaldehyde dehydrogenase/glycolaldehyde dehydrogenase